MGIDLIDELAGLTEAGPVSLLRGQRPEIAFELQARYLALLEPELANGLTLPDRALIAFRAASLHEDPALVAHYQRLSQRYGVTIATLGQVEAYPNNPALPMPLPLLLNHVDRVTLDPSSTTQAHLGTLEGLGYAPEAVAQISEIVALVALQARLIGALQAIGD